MGLRCRPELVVIPSFLVIPSAARNPHRPDRGTSVRTMKIPRRRLGMTMGLGTTSRRAAPRLSEFDKTQPPEVLLRNLGRLLRGPRVVRHLIELDDRPPVEPDAFQRLKHRRKIHPATSELDEPVGLGPTAGHRTLDILDMQEEQ